MSGRNLLVGKVDLMKIMSCLLENVMNVIQIQVVWFEYFSGLKHPWGFVYFLLYLII